MDDKFKALLALPVVRFAPFYAAGLAVSYFGGYILGGVFAVLSALAAVFSAISRKPLWLCFVAFACGIAVMGMRLAFYCEPIQRFDGSTVTLDMVVCDEVYSSGDNQQVIVRAKLGGRSAKLRVTGADMVAMGDSFTAVVTLSLPDERYRLINAANDIMLSGEVEEYLSIEGARRDLRLVAYGFREGILDKLSLYLEGDTEAAARALFFGEDDRGSARLYHAIDVCGVTHLTAVSGTHFMIFAVILAELLGGGHPRQRAAVALAAAVIGPFFYGFAVSVIRSAIMMGLYSFAPLVHRRSETFYSLCFAVLAMVLVSPNTVLDAGFLMSVAGVFGTVVIAPRLCEAYLRDDLPGGGFVSGAAGAFIMSACAQVCTAPIVIALFGGVSLVGAFVTVILMPFMMVGMSAALLAGITGLGLFILPAGLAAKAAVLIIEFIGSCNTLWLPLNFKGAWQAALVFAVALTAVALVSDVRKVGLAVCTVLTMFSLLMSVYVRNEENSVYFIREGRSGAAVFCHGSRAAVFISGTGAGLSDNIAELLLRRGVSGVACVIAPDADYCGSFALRELCEMYEVGAVYSGSPAVTRDICGDVVSEKVPAEVRISGVSIMSAPARDFTACADIVLYHSYIRSEPKSDAGLAVYISPSQKLLPPNGVRIPPEGFSRRLPENEFIVEVTVEDSG